MFLGRTPPNSEIAIATQLVDFDFANNREGGDPVQWGRVLAFRKQINRGENQLRDIYRSVTLLGHNELSLQVDTPLRHDRIIKQSLVRKIVVVSHFRFARR